MTPRVLTGVRINIPSNNSSLYPLKDSSVKKIVVNLWRCKPMSTWKTSYTFGITHADITPKAQNKRPQHPVEVFRIWLLGITPVVPHVLMPELIIFVLCSGTSCSWWVHHSKFHMAAYWQIAWIIVSKSLHDADHLLNKEQSSPSGCSIQNITSLNRL